MPNALDETIKETLDREIGERARTARQAAPRPSSLLELVAGAFAVEVSHIWAGSSIAEYMMTGDRQRHVWHCWMASPDMPLLPQVGIDAASICRHLSRTRSRDLLVGAYGICPPGLLAALGKCGPRARQPEWYRALVKALARDDLGAKHLRHSRELSDLLVFNIAALPTRLHSKSVFEALRRGAISSEDFANVSWSLARLEGLGLNRRVDPILKAAKPIQALAEAIGTLTFPAPPWPGTDRLRPIPSFDQLQQVGKALQNCAGHREDAAHFALRVVRGQTYYYALDGMEPALLEFESAAPLGWTLSECRGMRNQPLSVSTWNDVEAALGTWPDLAPVWMGDDGEVLGDGFFRHRLF